MNRAVTLGMLMYFGEPQFLPQQSGDHARSCLVWLVRGLVGAEHTGGGVGVACLLVVLLGRLVPPTRDTGSPCWASIGPWKGGMGRM